MHGRREERRETGVDGGGSCGKCATVRGCSVAGDCVSGVCGAGGSCSAPVCTDGVKNGVETAVDWGDAGC
ncbi:MAG: hypothetical protein R3F39_22575 [Myxococcota bacterium]